MNPSHIAIRNPATIFILTLMIVVIGVSAYNRLPREAAPDIQIPLLIVTIPFPGASPEDVEFLVTHKVETVLQNVENLKEITSTSSEGVASVKLEFELGFKVDDARVKVREKMDGVRPELPDDVEDPIISEINLSEQPMMIVNLAGEVGLVLLKDVAEDLKEAIEGIPGILEVNRAGGLEQEVKIMVDPEKLRYYHISLNQLSRAVEKENTNIPGGLIEIGPTKYLIRVPGEFKTPEEIKDVVVAAPNQQPVFVKDVARVNFGYKTITSHSRLDDKESVSLVIIKRSGENLLKIREEIQNLVEKYQSNYAGRINFTMLADQSVFVKRILRDLENNIITGFLLVFLVLLIVMGKRNALFVATAIPLSFLLTLVVMEMMGFTLNFVVLFSLILALGMLVDNAIVVVENIYRHLQAGKNRIEAAMTGISEVAVPVTTSTITTLVAFAPVIFMPGIVGEFMTYLPQTLIVALTSSLFVALIINPVLCSVFMGGKPATKSSMGTVAAKTAEGSPKNTVDDNDLAMVVQSPLLQRYRRILEFNLRHRLKMVAGVIVLFVVIAATYGMTTLKRKGVEFFPSTEPETATISIETPSGSTLDTTDKYSRQVEAAVKPLDQYITTRVANVGQRQGFGGAGGSGATSHLSYIKIEFPQWQEWTMRPSEVIAQLRESILGVAGADVRLSKSQSGPPTGPPVNIELRGDSFEEMLAVAEDIKRKIQHIPGLVNLRDNFDRSRPEIRVIIDREKTARMGLSTQDLALTVRTAFQGRKVSEYREGKDEYDIIVRLDESFRVGPENLERLYLVTPSGEQVPLSELATISTGPGYGSIRHIELERVITIVGDNSEGTPGPVVLGKVQALLTDYELPPGISMGYTGENKDRQEAQSFLAQSFLIALFMIFMVLVTQFNSVATPFIIMSSVVLSLMGVFLGLMIHDRPFSVVMSGIGVISLAGIVVNNAIVLIDFINQLRKRGYPMQEAVALASMTRMRPVLLTAGTTILGLLPIVMGMDIDFYRWPLVVFGSEGGAFWVPMSLAVIYGLFLATAMTLIWVPMLYTIVEDGKIHLGAKLHAFSGGLGGMRENLSAKAFPSQTLQKLKDKALVHIPRRTARKPDAKEDSD